MPTTYIHKSTLTEYTLVKVGPKVIIMKCSKAGLKGVKVGDIQKTSPAALMVLYTEKITDTNS